MKTPVPSNDVDPGLMAANVKDTASFMRTRLADDEKEIATQKERADNAEKLVTELASRLDLEERRMARFMMRVSELEKKVNAAPTEGQSKSNVSTVKIAKPEIPKVAVKLMHSELPATVAKSLESKHVPTHEPHPVTVPSKATASKSKTQETPKWVATADEWKSVMEAMEHRSGLFKPTPVKVPATATKSMESKHIPPKAKASKADLQGSPKPPIAVKLTHSELPAKAAESLESKHMPAQASASKNQLPKVPKSFESKHVIARASARS